MSDEQKSSTYQAQQSPASEAAVPASGEAHKVSAAPRDPEPSDMAVLGYN